MTCPIPRNSGTQRRNARGIVVANSIRMALAAPHLSELPPSLTNAREADFIRLALSSPRLDSH